MSSTKSMATQPNLSLQKKSAARIAAAQCVYERIINKNSRSPEQQIASLKRRLTNNANEQKLILGAALEPNYTILKDILEGTKQWQNDIDKRIDGSLSKEWKRERMSPILIAILECAIFELFFYKDTKHKILIDEYTNITSRFFSEAEINFVNGALKNLHTKFHDTSNI